MFHCILRVINNLRMVGYPHLLLKCYTMHVQCIHESLVSFDECNKMHLCVTNDHFSVKQCIYELVMSFECCTMLYESLMVLNVIQCLYESLNCIECYTIMSLMSYECYKMHVIVTDVL